MVFESFIKTAEPTALPSYFAINQTLKNIKPPVTIVKTFAPTGNQWGLSSNFYDIQAISRRYYPDITNNNMVLLANKLDPIYRMKMALTEQEVRDAHEWVQAQRNMLTLPADLQSRLNSTLSSITREQRVELLKSRNPEEALGIETLQPVPEIRDIIADYIDAPVVSASEPIAPTMTMDQLLAPTRTQPATSMEELFDTDGGMPAAEHYHFPSVSLPEAPPMKVEDVHDFNQFKETAYEAIMWGMELENATRGNIEHVIIDELKKDPKLMHDIITIFDSVEDFIGELKRMEITSISNPHSAFNKHLFNRYDYLIKRGELKYQDRPVSSREKKKEKETIKDEVDVLIEQIKNRTREPEPDVAALAQSPEAPPLIHNLSVEDIVTNVDDYSKYADQLYDYGVKVLRRLPKRERTEAGLLDNLGHFDTVTLKDIERIFDGIGKYAMYVVNGLKGSNSYERTLEETFLKNQQEGYGRKRKVKKTKRN